MENNFTSALKTSIEKTLGRRILCSTDCRHLHNDIIQKTSLNISFNTLRRFFNLINAKYEQSTDTLDILAEYCGFTTYDNFIRCQKLNSPSEFRQQNAKLLLYLVMLFKNTEVKDVSDFTFYKLVAQTITFLESNSSLIEEFQFEIAKTLNGQTFYFEHFVNIDRLNCYYGEGIRYYLNENKTLSGQLFGNYIYCLKYFLTMDSIELKKLHNNIIVNDICKTMNSATAAYSFSAQMLYAQTADINPDKILVNVRQYYSAYDPSNESPLTVINFFNTLSLTLILTDLYEEALFFIDEMLNFIKTNNLEPYKNSILHNVYMLKALAVYNCGNKILAKQIFDSINPLSFFFLSKEFMTILYLSLKQCYKKSSNEQSHINELIRKTGFYLLNIKFSRLNSLPHPIEETHNKIKFTYSKPSKVESEEITS